METQLHIFSGPPMKTLFNFRTHKPYFSSYSKFHFPSCHALIAVSKVSCKLQTSSSKDENMNNKKLMGSGKNVSLIVPTPKIVVPDSNGAPPLTGVTTQTENGTQMKLPEQRSPKRDRGVRFKVLTKLTTRVLSILANLKLALTEMFTVAALMALGTVIDQGEAPDFYFQKYPEENPVLGFFTWKWVLTLGFDHMFSSPVFLGILGLLGASLMACSYTTQIPLVKVAKRWSFSYSTDAIRKQDYSDTLPRASIKDLGVVLMGAGYEVFCKGPSLYAFKGLAGRFAPIGVHLALILIMGGATLSAVGSFRGSVTVPQGLNFVVGDVLGPSGFLSTPSQAFNTEVHVNRFYMDFYDSGEVSQFHSDLSLYDLNGKEVMRRVFWFAEAKEQQWQEEEPFVGVNIGTDVSNLLPPAQLVSFLLLQKITHVRLYDADPVILKSLAKTGIRVIIGVPDNEILAIGSSNASAASWVDKNVAMYYPETIITGIAVGDEVFTTMPSSIPLLMPAIEALYSALVAANLHNHIIVSTPSASSIVLDPFPPSQAIFNQSFVSVISQLLQFLSRTKSPLMMNLYPYYVFMQNKGVVPLENALFKPLTPSEEMVDPSTLLHYTNLLDAMIDSVYVSIKNLNVTDVVVLVTETGWPSKGDSHEPFATLDNADTYNSNLIKHVIDHSGTPLHPEITSSVYIYELFNEDLRSPPVSEANWGLFYGNSTPAYLLHVSGIGTTLANDTTNQTYCIAADGVDTKTLQAALDWACGPGRANCSNIQAGESCYQPSNVKNHASYAFDSYYQKEKQSPGSCDFKGAAMITTTDPSLGNCVYPGSKQMSSKTRQTVNSTQAVSCSAKVTRFGGLPFLIWLFYLFIFAS